MSAYSGYQNRSGYRRKIRERDNYTCQLCGRYGYDVDHIIPWRISHDSSESNLRTLCHSCNCKTRAQRKRTSMNIEEWTKWLDRELAAYQT